MKYIFAALLFVMIPIASFSQIVGPIESKFNSIRQNGVGTVHTQGDTVWISPILNFNVNNSADWFLPEGIDSLTDAAGRVFSIDTEGSNILVGLGATTTVLGTSTPGAFGYYYSQNGGLNWDYLKFPLDNPQPQSCNSQSYDPNCDITFIYGGNNYTRIRFTVPQQSPPYDVSQKGSIFMSVNWASGLLRSLDAGQTWERLILPPSTADSLVPSETYNWPSRFNGQAINRYDPREDNNLLGFGLLIDSNDQVWVGTAGGLNISDNALTAPFEQIRWVRKSVRTTNNSLLGNWIISIEEEPASNRIWMTNWIANQGDRFGIVYTEDNGETFKQMLIGQKISDIGFKDGYVFAAGDNGLFISSDSGISWIKSPQIKSANSFIKESAQFFSVATTSDRVWIGTSDGIISTDDYGQTWEINRVDFPLEGGNAYDPEANSVDTYAYPNPFSPIQHEIVRMKFEVKEVGNVKVRIFDVGMNLVREVENDFFTTGTYEALWNGQDEKGRMVANAPYIYVIEMADRTINGKILMVQ